MGYSIVSGGSTDTDAQSGKVSLYWEAVYSSLEYGCVLLK